MIDPNFKNDLMAALNTAVAAYNTHPDPSQAVVKAAREYDFNEEQTKRLVETFNTARTLYQYGTGEKSAEFQLADADRVLYDLFTSTGVDTKCAASDLYDYSEYERGEYMAKAGRLLDASDEVDIRYRSTEETIGIDKQADSFYKHIRGYRSQADEAMSVARQAALAGEGVLTKIACSFAIMSEQVGLSKYARLCKAYGWNDRTGPVMRRLHGYIPSYIKQATAPKVTGLIDLSDTQTIVDDIKKAQTLFEEAAGLQTIGQIMADEADSKQAAFEAQFGVGVEHPEVDVLASFFNKHAATTRTVSTRGMPTHIDLLSATELDDKLKDVTRDETVIDAPTLHTDGMLGKAVGKTLESTLQRGAETMFNSLEQSRDDYYTKANRKMTDRLRNVQRQVLLQDLYMNDSVISEADPETIQNAFNAVLQLAPEVTTNKEVMRAIMRQAIHSVAISPYDAQAWTELETQIQEVQGKRPPVKQMRVGEKYVYK